MLKNVWMSLLLSVFAVFLMAAPSSAQTCYLMNQSEPSSASPATLMGQTLSSQEYSFTANDNLLVTKLGVRISLNGEVSLGNNPGRSFTISLWDDDSQSRLAKGSISLSSTPGWQFVDVGTPVLLTKGTGYRVSYHPDDGDVFNVYQIPPSTTSDLLFKPSDNVSCGSVVDALLNHDWFPSYENTVDIGEELAVVRTISVNVVGLDPENVILLKLNGAQYAWV